MSKKSNLKDYIKTAQRIKPSAEVQFSSVQSDGSKSTISAKERYQKSVVSSDTEMVAESGGPATGSLKSRISKISTDHPPVANAVNDIKNVVEQIDALEESVKAESITETIEVVEPSPLEDLSPVADQDVPDEEVEVAVSSDVGLILSALERLVDKIDAMQNFTPVIHVPAPVIHVTLPETRRTVTKAIERDDNHLIKTVRESVEEMPVGEATIEIIKEDIHEDD